MLPLHQLGDMVALLIGHRTCNLQVTDSSPNWALLPWASYLHLCASVTKQYNLVPTKGVISSAGKVSVGLVESNSSSLQPGLRLMSPAG